MTLKNLKPFAFEVGEGMYVCRFEICNFLKPMNFENYSNEALECGVELFISRALCASKVCSIGVCVFELQVYTFSAKHNFLKCLIIAICDIFSKYNC